MNLRANKSFVQFCRAILEGYHDLIRRKERKLMFNPSIHDAIASPSLWLVEEESLIPNIREIPYPRDCKLIFAEPNEQFLILVSVDEVMMVEE